MNNITEAVTDALDLQNVPPHVISKVPSLIKRAVVELQKVDVIPPKYYEFVSGYKEEVKVDASGNKEYSFWRMPEDFRKLQELYVGDNENPYSYIGYENYFWSRDKENRKKVFTVADITVNEAMVSVIIADPFPSRSTPIRITYHTNGTDSSLEYLKEEYNNVIIDKVLELVGLKSREESENSAIEMSSQWRRRQGINRVNATMQKIKPKFFGKWEKQTNFSLRV